MYAPLHVEAEDVVLAPEKEESVVIAPCGFGPRGHERALGGGSASAVPKGGAGVESVAGSRGGVAATSAARGAVAGGGGAGGGGTGTEEGGAPCTCGGGDSGDGASCAVVQVVGDGRSGGNRWGGSCA